MGPEGIGPRRISSRKRPCPLSLAGAALFVHACTEGALTLARPIRYDGKFAAPCATRLCSSVAQRQSIRLLTGGLLVRIQPEEPFPFGNSTTFAAVRSCVGPRCPFLALFSSRTPSVCGGGVGLERFTRGLCDARFHRPSDRLEPTFECIFVAHVGSLSDSDGRRTALGAWVPLVRTTGLQTTIHGLG